MTEKTEQQHNKTQDAIIKFVENILKAKSKFDTATHKLNINNEISVTLPELFSLHPKIHFNCGCTFEKKKRLFRKTIIKIASCNTDCEAKKSLMQTSIICNWKIEKEGKVNEV